MWHNKYPGDAITREIERELAQQAKLREIQERQREKEKDLQPLWLSPTLMILVPEDKLTPEYEKKARKRFGL